MERNEDSDTPAHQGDSPGIEATDREREERIRLYREWAQDEELRQSVRESADLAYQLGVL